MPGIAKPEPKGMPSVCVTDTTVPAASAQAKWVVCSSANWTASASSDGSGGSVSWAECSSISGTSSRRTRAGFGGSDCILGGASDRILGGASDRIRVGGSESPARSPILVSARRPSGRSLDWVGGLSSLSGARGAVERLVASRA